MKKFKKVFMVWLAVVFVFTCLIVTSCTKKDVVNNEITSHGRPIELKVKRLANTTEEGVVVNATVNPGSVINDKLNWTLEWSSASSEQVSNYVSMVVSEDTHSVTLIYKQPFNKQLILKVTSVLTPTINTTCSIDCYKRTIDFLLDFALETSDGDDFIPTVDNSKKTVDFSAMNYSMLDDISICDCDLYSLVQTGTINVTNKKIVKFSLAPVLKAKLTNAGFNTSEFYYVENPNNYAESIYDLLCELIEFTSSSEEEVFKILGTSFHWFDMTCIVVDMSGSTEVNSFTKVYKMTGFDISDGLSVTSINLNKTNIVF